MQAHVYFKAHLTFADGSTESCVADRMYDVLSEARHLIVVAHVVGIALEKMRLSKMLYNGDELGPFELTFVED